MNWHKWLLEPMDVSCVTSYHNLTLPKPIKVLKAVPKSHAIRDDVGFQPGPWGFKRLQLIHSQTTSPSVENLTGKNKVIYKILQVQVHHIYKHIFQYDVITPGR